MLEETQSLLLSDMSKFMEVVLKEDEQERLHAMPTSEDFVICEIIRYGIYNKQEMIPRIQGLYAQAIGIFGEDARTFIFNHVKGFVENTDFVTVSAFLPFICIEKSRSIVSTAIIDYVSLGLLTDNDPMQFVKAVVGMMENGAIQNYGAAFGALLNLGDPRVCKLLLKLRHGLGQEEVDEVVKCSTGILHGATVEFYLDWLEGFEGDDGDGLFGSVASGLALHVRNRQTEQVTTGIRPFPTKGVTGDEWRELAKFVPLADYVQKIAPRLFALERMEPPPRVMPIVIEAWGLIPKSDPSQIAELVGARQDKAMSASEDLSQPGNFVRSSDQWSDAEGMAFLAWGILNPNGPTLYLLGSREFGGKSRIFFRWLHMLGGETTYGQHCRESFSYQEILDESAEIQQFLTEQNQPTVFSEIPNFLAASGGDEKMRFVAFRLLINSPCSRKDWGREFAYLNRFQQDFFARAGAEVREYIDSQKADAKIRNSDVSDTVKMMEQHYSGIPDFENAVVPNYSSEALSPEMLEKWWAISGDPKYTLAAFGTLKTMWEGACGLMPDKMQSNLVKWDTVLKLLIDLKFALPEAGEGH